MNTGTRQTVASCIRSLQQSLDQHPLFYGHGTDNAGAEAQWLVTAVLDRAGYGQISNDTPVPEREFGIMTAILAERIATRKPLAYLLGEAWFAGHRFYVDERVLVPRSPIAELIDNGFSPLLDRDPGRILDLCCGSGCIGIAAGLAFPAARVALADVSRAALEVARKNIGLYKLNHRVKAISSDLFEALEGPFDLVLCNPPYVSEAEYTALPEEYQREPALGLVSPGEGLAIPLAILRQAADYLDDEGLLILEVGHAWPALEAALPDLPLLWLDFEHGGEGVCAIRAAQLRRYFRQPA